MSGSLHIGFFSDSRDLLDAVSECRERKIPIRDVISPAPVHGLDEHLGIKPSRLPWITLVGGAVGLAAGFALQYWAAAIDWPLNVGGKPLNSLPAFMPVAFELTILIAGLSTAFVLLMRSRIWPWRRAPSGFEATTDDRIALILAQRDASFPEEVYADVLLRNGAVDLRHEVEAAS